ncbi:hypothetical protein, partial [Aquitalea magnusonii]|uniref:hypothetical protein n=1 Tax=Aquitalea magnusonii TaxID=332411 RepID=UPI00128F3104
DGISTFMVGQDGTVYIENLITSYQKMRSATRTTATWRWRRHQHLYGRSGRHGLHREPDHLLPENAFGNPDN